MSQAAAAERASTVLASLAEYERLEAVNGSLLRTSTALPDLSGAHLAPQRDEHEAIGTPWGAASASFLFFASGAVIPVLPYLLGASGWVAVGWSAGLVGVALLLTGAVVGLLSGSAPTARALRQLAIGWGAAALTYLLGLAFGSSGI
jgi:VIT1/CCC1 family predicted Fe2+/Mn2+ transporter